MCRRRRSVLHPVTQQFVTTIARQPNDIVVTRVDTCAYPEAEAARFAEARTQTGTRTQNKRFIGGLINGAKK